MVVYSLVNCNQLIAINVGLFGWQILSGVNITDPSPMDAIAWDADFPPLTFSGQPERLFNSMFSISSVLRFQASTMPPISAG